MKRLLDGKARVTDGALTKANVHREAGVSRATLFRAPHLLAWWDQQVAERSDQAPRTSDRDTQLAQLKAQISQQKQKIAEQERIINGAHGIIAAQNVLLESLREQLETGEVSKITPLRRT